VIEKDRLGRAASIATLPPGFRSELLEGLKPSEVTRVLATARRRRVSSDQVVQHEGAQACHFCLLETGLAAFYKATAEGTRIFLRWITPGDAFGLAVVQAQRQPYLVTVRALQGSSILVWERVSAHALFLQIPRLRENVYGIASAYFAHLTDMLVAYASQTARQRIARGLVESARRVGHAESKGIEIALTNEQLAEMASVSVFTVSRQVREWQRQGILTKSRKKIVLCATERLSTEHS